MRKVLLSVVSLFAVVSAFTPAHQILRTSVPRSAPETKVAPRDRRATIVNDGKANGKKNHRMRLCYPWYSPLFFLSRTQWPRWVCLVKCCWLPWFAFVRERPPMLGYFITCVMTFCQYFGDSNHIAVVVWMFRLAILYAIEWTRRISKYPLRFNHQTANHFYFFTFMIPFFFFH